MVDLQDAANVALIVSLGANAWNYLYGPWAGRRVLQREAIAKVATELQVAKAAALAPLMNAHMGQFPTWSEKENQLPRRIRSSVGPFVELCASYWDAYLLASRLLKLIIY